MLIKFGAIVTDGRGKLGGHVFSKNAGGNYMRTNGIPTNPRSVWQQSGRAILGGLSQDWSGLSEEQIESWNNATELFKRTNAFGDSKKLSGKNLFTSLNKNLIQVGGDKLENAPTPEPTVPVVNFEMGYSDNTATWNFQPEFLDGDPPRFIVIRATPVVSAGTSYVKNDLRVIYAEAFTGDPDDINDFIGEAYVNRLGSAPDGTGKVYFSSYTINQVGQRSPEVIKLGNFE